MHGCCSMAKSPEPQSLDRDSRLAAMQRMTGAWKTEPTLSVDRSKCGTRSRDGRVSRPPPDGTPQKVWLKASQGYGGLVPTRASQKNGTLFPHNA
jgi:hypothetical protein